LREVVEDVVSEYERKIFPNLRCFRKGFLHGDLNLANVIVAEDFINIKGVIDFGDAVWSSILNEIAIAMAYSGMKPIDEDNFLETLEYVL